MLSSSLRFSSGSSEKMFLLGSCSSTCLLYIFCGRTPRSKSVMYLSSRNPLLQDLDDLMTIGWRVTINKDSSTGKNAAQCGENSHWSECHQQWGTNHLAPALLDWALFGCQILISPRPLISGHARSEFPWWTAEMLQETVTQETFYRHIVGNSKLSIGLSGSTISIK